MRAIAEQLAQIIHLYTEKIQHIDDPSFSVKPGNDKWSKKEILGHLVDSAQNNIQRFVRVQYESEPNIVYNQDEWVKTQSYNSWNRGELLDLWQLSNKQIGFILKHFPEEKKTLKAYMNKELCTIEYIAQDYIRHLLHHLNQIIS
ncbi:DinB family protein [Niabella sp. CC-SYL272]|uniref:DinB family protein n=1 Tax=Niabella agricola TaxID=2891571 RepID=UPI001F26B343|nr:DinB family protein [Niabella agricola]MCF3109322.1 DinB family protein [Niabella agricola]